MAIGNGKDPARDDFASFIMIKVYKIMNDVFMDCRRRVRDDLAAYFTFLFKPWGDFNVLVTDESLDLRWVVPFDEMQRVPEHKIRDCLERDTDTHIADTWNRSVYDHMVTQRSLRLLVGHDILMAKGKPTAGAQRVHAGGPDGRFRYFRRWLSMLVPSAVFFLGWANMPVDMQAYKALRVHPKSMKVLYSTAVLFRDVFDLHPARSILDGLNAKRASGRQFEGSAEERSLLRMFFEILIPGKTCFERAMERTTMAMSDKSYDEQHVLSRRERLEREALAGAGPSPAGPAVSAARGRDTGEGDTAAGGSGALEQEDTSEGATPSRSDERPAANPEDGSAADDGEGDGSGEENDEGGPNRQLRRLRRRVLRPSLPMRRSGRRSVSGRSSLMTGVTTVAR